MPGTFSLLIIQLCEWIRLCRGADRGPPWLAASAWGTGHGPEPLPGGTWVLLLFLNQNWTRECHRHWGNLEASSSHQNLHSLPTAMAARTPIGEPPFFFSCPRAQLRHKWSWGRNSCSTSPTGTALPEHLAASLLHHLFESHKKKNKVLRTNSKFLATSPSCVCTGPTGVAIIGSAFFTRCYRKLLWQKLSFSEATL